MKESSYKVGDLIELTIDSLSYGGGRGVGRLQGRVFFVPWSAPGDVIQARITQIKKNFAEAEIVDFVSASATRVKPLCPVFGTCGGCRFQHLSYEEQLFQKNKYIRQALRFLSEEIIEPLKPSPKPFFYRNRIQVHLSDQKFGFLKAKSDQLVAVKGCPISEEPIHQFLGSSDAFKILRQHGNKKVEIALGPEGTLHFGKASDAKDQNLFSQVNRFQNEFLIETVTQLALQAFENTTNTDLPILDLYAGAGNLSFPLHEKLRRPVFAVELSQPSVLRGRSLVGFRAVQFFQSGVEEFLSSTTVKQLRAIDLVVADPPREGLSQRVLTQLVQLEPTFILHVGCHLMNFSRDLQRFIKEGYRVFKVQPLDMFPQTDHVELVALVGRP